MKQPYPVPQETSSALKLPRNSRPDAMLALIFSSFAFLLFECSMFPILNYKLALSWYIPFQLFTPALVLELILSLLGLIFSIRGLIFFIRRPWSRRRKELIFVIIGFIFTILVLPLASFLLFLFTAFSLGGAPYPG